MQSADPGRNGPLVKDVAGSQAGGAEEVRVCRGVGEGIAQGLVGPTPPCDPCNRQLVRLPRKGRGAKRNTRPFNLGQDGEGDVGKLGDRIQRIRRASKDGVNGLRGTVRRRREEVVKITTSRGAWSEGNSREVTGTTYVARAPPPRSTATGALTSPRYRRESVL